MQRKIILFSAILTMASLSLCGRAAAQSILPLSFSSWTENSKAPFAPSEMPTRSGASVDGKQLMAVAEEYGFAAGERATYVHGADQIDVMVYRMKDASGAYGEYSYLRTQDMPHSDLAEHSAMSRDRALVLDGNLLLDIRGTDLPKRSADLKSLISAANPRAEKGLLPTLMNNLPTKDIVERTDHYLLGPAALNQFFPVALGNEIGFSEGAEGELARYRVNQRDLTLLIVDFPTPQTAIKELKELQQQFNVNDSKNGRGLPAVYAKRVLTSLAFVAGATSQTDANVLLSQVQSGAELTWNEPSFSLTEPSIGTMIVGTIVGTGIICLFALIAGLAFGGVRLVVKRALPDKVFDRSDQLQILQLGLASKPIEAEDFYGLGTAPRA